MAFLVMRLCAFLIGWVIRSRSAAAGDDGPAFEHHSVLDDDELRAQVDHGAHVVRDELHGLPYRRLIVAPQPHGPVLLVGPLDDAASLPLLGVTVKARGG